jgi:predicted RNA-binding protein with PUA-like domain
MAYWLVKQEPTVYSWDDLVRDGHTTWDGVRNFQARNNLQAMQLGDLLLYYHSVEEKRIAGIAQLTRLAFPDVTAPDKEAAIWVAVEIAPVIVLKLTLTLSELKQDALLRQMAFIKQSRLSVSPVTDAEFARVLELSQTNLPR